MKFNKKKLEFQIFVTIIVSLILISSMRSINIKKKLMLRKEHSINQKYSSFAATEENLGFSDDDLSMFTKDPDEESNDLLSLPPINQNDQNNKPNKDESSDRKITKTSSKIDNESEVNKLTNSIITNTDSKMGNLETNKSKVNKPEGNKFNNLNNKDNDSPSSEKQKQETETKDKKREINESQTSISNPASTSTGTSPQHKESQSNAASTNSSHKHAFDSMRFSSMINRIKFKSRKNNVTNNSLAVNNEKKELTIHDNINDFKKSQKINETFVNNQTKKEIDKMKKENEIDKIEEKNKEIEKLQNLEENNMSISGNNFSQETKSQNAIKDNKQKFIEKKISYTEMNNKNNNPQANTNSNSYNKSGLSNINNNQINHKSEPKINKYSNESLNEFNHSLNNTPLQNALNLDNVSNNNSYINNNNNSNESKRLNNINTINNIKNKLQPKNGKINKITPAKRNPWLNLLQVKDENHDSSDTDNQTDEQSHSNSNDDLKSYNLSKTEATLDNLTDTQSQTNSKIPKDDSNSGEHNPSTQSSDSAINPNDNPNNNEYSTYPNTTSSDDNPNQNILHNLDNRQNENKKNDENISNNNISEITESHKNNNLRNNNNEGIKLFSQLDTNFVQNLIKIQNDPDIKNILTRKNINYDTNPYTNSNFISTYPNSYSTNSLDQREKINKNLLRKFYKPNALDISKLNYLNNLIGNIRNEIQKKTIENDQMSETNNQMDRNYEQLNGQLMILQTKFDSILNEISIIKGIKNSQSIQTEKIKEANKILTDTKEFFNKISDDISSKSDSIEKYEHKVQNDLKNFGIEKQNLEKTYQEKSQSAEEFKKSYVNTEKTKYQSLEKVKNYFEEFSKEEIKYLKLKNEENELQMQLKNEENSEKLIALEIEHLKSTNMMEIQKIEELKQEIDKSKNMRDYLKKEIEELEDKLKNADSENKQNQIEYELKKNELEEKLNELKSEMKNEELLNKEEKQKYSQIESDIKNKISYVTLQNFNVLEPDVNQKRNENINTFNSYYNKNEQNLQDVNKMNDPYSFRQNMENVSQINSSSQTRGDLNIDENSLKKQILMMLKKIND